MQRWPRFQGPRQQGPSLSFSMVALMVEYLGGMPLAKKGTKPQRSVTPSRSPSAIRTTGTC
jgi:hypothetical protein